MTGEAKGRVETENRRKKITGKGDAET